MLRSKFIFILFVFLAAFSSPEARGESLYVVEPHSGISLSGLGADDRVNAAPFVALAMTASAVALHAQGDLDLNRDDGGCIGVDEVDSMASLVRRMSRNALPASAGISAMSRCLHGSASAAQALTEAVALQAGASSARFLIDSPSSGAVDVDGSASMRDIAALAASLLRSFPVEAKRFLGARISALGEIHDLDLVFVASDVCVLSESRNVPDHVRARYPRSPSRLAILAVASGLDGPQDCILAALSEVERQRKRLFDHGLFEASTSPSS